MNAKVDKFLDACARDPWFAAHPEALKTIQGELTRIYEKSPDDAAVQTDWDSVSEIVSRKELAGGSLHRAGQIFQDGEIRALMLWDACP